MNALFAQRAASLSLALSMAFSFVVKADQIIYDDALENGWQNWSWAAVNLANTSPVYSGSDSISVTSTNWQALYLSVAAMSSSPFTNLTFWINGGPNGGQQVRVAGILGGSAQSPVQLAPLPKNSWQQVTLSMSALGVANQPNFTGFWIQVESNLPVPTFYVDAISLVTNAIVAGTNPPVSITVNAQSNRNAISPMIYGVAFAASNQLADLNFTMNRSGGNEESTYNWEINAHGKGADYYFESYPDASATPGESADSVVANSKAAGAQTLITIPMMSWGPQLGPNRAIFPSYSIAKYGPQTGNDPYFTNAGNGVSVTNDTLITWNNPNDSYIPVDTNFQKAYVQHLITNWGVSTNGGVGYYIMDNEHSLWSSTHQDIHPVGPTMQEILGKIEAYASMVKSVDPQALVLGPEEWGWPGYFYSGYDQQWSSQNNNYNPADYPDRATNGGWDYMPWLLNQLSQYQTNTGQRLLDYFTLHCYPQEGNVSGNATDTATELLRNSSTRQFWDTNYVDPSWINAVIMLIPRMKNWVATNYPGTKIGITEYNWGAEPSISGATAQADILGIFGRESLDLATRWTTPASATPTYLAMKMYRNYDGNKSTFGETSILTVVPNPDELSAFGAVRSSDGAMTLMVINKDLYNASPIVVNITNFNSAGVAQRWQLTSDNLITQLVNITLTNGVLSDTGPAQSITLYVLPALALGTFSLQIGAENSSGQVPLWLNGTAGQTYIFQSSTNLVNWSAMSTNTLSSNSVEIFVPTTNSTRMFYRGLWNGL
jgi:hypothetical protein